MKILKPLVVLFLWKPAVIDTELRESRIRKNHYEEGTSINYKGKLAVSNNCFMLGLLSM